MSPRTASLLCYIPFVGWIGSLFVLATERFRHLRDVRFHAFQGLYLFVAWLIVDFFGRDFIPRSWMLASFMRLAVLCAWIYMLYETSQNKLVKLPFLGELADRSVDEQK